MSVKEKVIAIVSEQFSIPKEEVNRETFFNDLQADSLEIMELVMTLEDKFEITIADDDVEKIQTVGDAIGYIQEK